MNQAIQFPKPENVHINMMPIIMGNDATIPHKQYLSIINKCEFRKGDTVYLTIKESIVEKGKSHRRSGIHTDATRNGAWGGPWGGWQGIFLASSDGLCRFWDTKTNNVDDYGSLLDEMELSDIDSYQCEPNKLYKIGDRVPHESLRADSTHYRQFFRLVGPDIFGWFAEHSTPNPFGILPKAPVIDTNKFKTKKRY